ncbi:MAG: DNA replication/repair protein RecF [Pseudoramibacter sp.]
MIVTRLTLRAFRNYEEETFDFSPRINVITGDNAQGKTNLLEGLFLLSRGYSHRTHHLADLALQRGETSPGHFAVEAEVTAHHTRHRVALLLKNGSKQWIVDGHTGRRQRDVHKLMHTILFEPDDLRIVKAGPARRRRFINEEISGYLPAYLPVLKTYKKALSQRNALLKEVRRSPSAGVLLDSWDAQLVESGTKLVRYRLAYLKRLNETAKPLHDSLSDHKEQLNLAYSSNLIDQAADESAIQKRFAAKLKESRSRDIERGATGYGPHVDDLAITIDGMEARKFASQGQQRTAAIALKLSQIAIYQKITGESPIVLLDDILSELDEVRQEKILEILGQTQAFITCTDSRFSDRYPEDMKKIITIQHGHQI